MQNRVLIAVPSKKRAKILQDNILPMLIASNLPFKVFVEAEDEDTYSSIGIPPANLIIMPQHNLGLGKTKEVIKEYALAGDYEFVFKLDDDISGFTDFRTRFKTDQEKGERFRQIVDECVKELDKYDKVAVISFPYAFQMYDKFIWHKTKRVQTAYIARTEYFHADTRISVFEDFAVGINAIVNNKFVLQYGLAGIEMGVDVGGGTGGHQSFDRQERAKKEIEVVREMLPSLQFKKVDKIWQYEPDLRTIYKIGYY